MTETSSAEKEFKDFLLRGIKELKQSKDPHATAQSVMTALDKLPVAEENIYDDVLSEADEESMGTWQNIMDKESFIENGASKKDVQRMNKSNDDYFVDKAYDGVTPCILTSSQMLDQLETMLDIVKDGFY